MNDKIKNMKKTLLSDNWYILNKHSYDYQKPDGTWERQVREVYDRGNGATILLYNAQKRTVVLTKQFRIPTYLNGNPDGMLIETCAGLLDGDEPEECIRREAEEETGFRIDKVRKIMEAYMSPGAVTEKVFFFAAEYSDDMKISEGGGLDHEQEHIEVLELDFDQAYKMMATGEIQDGKTIMLLQYAKLHQIV